MFYRMKLSIFENRWVLVIIENSFFVAPVKNLLSSISCNCTTILKQLGHIEKLYFKKLERWLFLFSHQFINFTKNVAFQLSYENLKNSYFWKEETVVWS